MSISGPIISDGYRDVAALRRLAVEFRASGIALLPGLFEEEPLRLITGTFTKLFPARARQVEYFSEGDETWRRLQTINNREVITAEPLMADLYRSRELTDCVRTIVGSELHPELEYQQCVYNVHEEAGCEHGWHVDQGAYVLTTMVMENVSHGRAGGRLEFVPAWTGFRARHPRRSPTELYELAEREGRVATLFLEPGQSILTHASHVLHRVSPLREEGTLRVTHLLSWNDKPHRAEDETDTSFELYL